MTKSIETIRQPSGDDIYSELVVHGPLVALTVLLDAVCVARGYVEAERDAASERARARTAALAGARDAIVPPKAKAAAEPTREFTTDEQNAHVSAVSDVLKLGPHTLGALAGATGLGGDAIKGALARLRKAGMATCAGRTWSHVATVDREEAAE